MNTNNYKLLNMETLPTNKGELSIPKILDELTYSSYAANRNYGATHEMLFRSGIGNDAFKERYENDIN